MADKSMTAGPRAYGLLLATGAMLSLVAATAKLASQADLNPYLVAGAPPAVAGAVLWVIQRRRGVIVRLSSTHLRYYAVAGLLSVAAPYALSWSAIEHVGAGFISATYALPPLFTYALALVTGSERPSARRGFAAMLSFIGVAAFFSTRVDLRQDWLWAAIALATPVLLAIGNIYRAAAWPKNAPAASLPPGMLVLAGLWLLPLIAVTTPAHGMAITLSQLMILGLQAGLIAAFFSVFFALQRIAAPAFMSQIGYVSFGLGVPLGAILFAEAAHPVDLVWMAAVGAGVVLFGSGEARRTPQAERHPEPLISAGVVRSG